MGNAPKFYEPLERSRPAALGKIRKAIQVCVFRITIQSREPSGAFVRLYHEMGQESNFTVRHSRPVSGHGGISLGTLRRGEDIREFLSIHSRWSRINDKRHPARPGCSWVLPCVVRAPLDDSIPRILEVGLSTIRKDQNDFPGY